jgi:hypothetical protein
MDGVRFDDYDRDSSMSPPPEGSPPPAPPPPDGQEPLFCAPNNITVAGATAVSATRRAARAAPKRHLNPHARGAAGGDGEDRDRAYLCTFCHRQDANAQEVKRSIIDNCATDLTLGIDSIIYAAHVALIALDGKAPMLNGVMPLAVDLDTMFLCVTTHWRHPIVQHAVALGNHIAIGITLLSGLGEPINRGGQIMFRKDGMNDYARWMAMYQKMLTMPVRSADGSETRPRAAAAIGSTLALPATFR